jgi:curved DNA-binding protein CbpA
MMSRGSLAPAFRQLKPAATNHINMNGQLSEQPLAELIREISAKRLSGRLRLEHDRVKIVCYFQDGLLIYAAANVRSLRLGEYLKNGKLVSDSVLAGFGEQRSDLALGEALCTAKLLEPAAVARLHIQQVSDVLRVALLWTEGSWEFDNQSHLSEQVNFKIDMDTLILEAGRRMLPKFAASRFENQNEMISQIASLPGTGNLTAAEGFLLSRLETPSVLSDLVSVSGLREPEALRVIYGLALAGFVQRENWKSASLDHMPAQPAQKSRDAEARGSGNLRAQRKTATDEDGLDEFLAKLGAAITHYEVLGVAKESEQAEIKRAYYELARRYHPDRFRTQVELHARIESAFARITQAYDTLGDAGPRANYDSKLEARARGRVPAGSTPQTTAQVPPPTGTPKVDGEKVDEATLSTQQRAENNFKEGLAALQQGQTNIAIGLLSAAARLAPNVARYRAQCGHALAAHENTRRLAEVELQAAIKLEPDNAKYRVMLAQLYQDLGFSHRARGEAERAIALDPNNSKARELLQKLK